MKLITLLLSIFLIAATYNYPKTGGSGGGGGGSGLNKYANQASLPVIAFDGDTAVTTDSQTLWVYKLGTSTWLPVASAVLYDGTLTQSFKNKTITDLSNNISGSVITSGTPSADAPLNCPTKIIDTHGAFNTATGVWTAPRGGFVTVKYNTVVSGTGGGTGSTYITGKLFLNGSNYNDLIIYNLDLYSSIRTFAHGEFTTIPVKMGDTLSVGITGNITSPTWASAAGLHSITFEMK